MWGSLDTFPSQCDYVLDTRHEDEEPYEAIPEGNYHVENYQIRPFMEPEFSDHWDETGRAIVNVVKEGKKLFILDSDGTERSAMIAWFVFTKIQNCHPEDAFVDFQKEYLKWEDRPNKWIQTQVPRCARQVMWAMWKLLDVSFDSFSNSYGKNVKRGKNRALRVNGDISCGELIHRLVSMNYHVLRKKGYNSIQIVSAGGHGENWGELRDDKLINIQYRFQHIADSIAIQDASTFHHLWRSLFVYNDKHLDENGKPNAQFFIDQDVISRWTASDIYSHHIYENFPDGIWWFGEIFPYDYAKVYIWSPIYAFLVEQTSAYRELKNLMVSGINLLLLDYDGLAFDEHGFTYEQYVESVPSKWNHCHVLYGMLKNIRPWEDRDVLKLVGML